MCRRADQGPLDQPTPTGADVNGTSPASTYVRKNFACPSSSNSMYVTRCMVINSLVGGTLSYPGILSATVCRPCQVVSCTSRLPSASSDIDSPRISGKASSTRRKRSTYPLGPVDVLPRVWSTSTTSGVRYLATSL